MEFELIEFVEVCPHCEHENVFKNGVQKNGYIVTCGHCGKQIFLCSACMESADNPAQDCDWCKTGNRSCCKRGTIIEVCEVYVGGLWRKRKTI